MVKDFQSTIFIGPPETIVGKYPPNLDNLVIETEELAIGVDTIRNLKKQLAIQSVKGKTAIFPQAEKLTIEAQNALLKTLEEPPANTTIILVTSSLDKLLPTVTSRCQIVFLPPKLPVLSEKDNASAQKILGLIEKEDITSGFPLVSKISDRQEALAFLDKLLIVCQKAPSPKTFQKLTRAKKYLQSSTNVRLTLENLFL